MPLKKKKEEVSRVNFEDISTRSYNGIRVAFPNGLGYQPWYQLRELGEMVPDSQEARIWYMEPPEVPSNTHAQFC